MTPAKILAVEGSAMIVAWVRND